MNPSRSRHGEEFDRYDIVIDGRRYVVSRRRPRRFPLFPHDDYAYNPDSVIIFNRYQPQHSPPSKRACRVLVTDAAIRQGLREVTPGADAKLLLQTECAVCLKDFDADDKLMAMPCAHAFHEQCIFPWLRRNAVCPLCRAPLPTPPTQEDDKDQTASNVPAPEDP